MPPTPTKQASAGDYRYMGTHATEIQIGDTLPWLEPGEIVSLSSEDLTTPKAMEMVSTGVLVDISTITASAEAELKEMTADKSTTTDSTKGGK